MSKIKRYLDDLVGEGADISDPRVLEEALRKEAHGKDK